MNDTKVLEVLRTYRTHFVAMRVEPKDYPHDELVGPRQGEDVLAHCCGMLPKIELFIHEGKIGKAKRWLGFIQGCLWTSGIYTLTNLMNHNRPDEPEP